MWNDLRFAWRTLRRAPGFAVLAVLSLALGIGANTAIFSLLYQVVMRSIPVRDPAGLVWLESDDNNYGNSRRDNNLSVFSYPMYRSLRDRNHALRGLVARVSFPAALSSRSEAERVTAEVVTGNFFEVMGVRPALGRLLLPSDDSPGAAPAIVLSYAYWLNHCGADAGILHRRILLNREPVTVAGVAPPGFRGLLTGSDPDFFAPLSMMQTISPGWDWNERVDCYWLSVVGRLKPGITRQQASSSLQPLFRSILREEAPEMKGLTGDSLQKTLAKPLRAQSAAQGLNSLRSRWETPLMVLAVMVGLVQLIACVNVASLLIARATARQREIAIRLAVGASRAHLVRQLLVESTALAIAGGVLGLFLSQILMQGLLGLLPAHTAGGWLVPQLDFRLLGFSLALALLTGMLFGLAPALQAARTGVAPALKAQSGGMSAHRSQARSRQALMAAQICVSLLLLIGAGLFTRSLINLLHNNPGFRAEHLFTFSIDPSLNGYTLERRMALFDDLRQRLRSLPGVQSAASAWLVPLGGYGWGNGIRNPQSTASDANYINCNENAVSPGYFAALGIPLLSGRDFNRRDDAHSPLVVILSESFARSLFPKGDALGRLIHQGMGDNDVRIVGVVADTHMNDLREKPPYVLYSPFDQNGDAFTRQSAFFVRTLGDGRGIPAAIRSVVKQLDRDLPIERLTSMKVMLDDSIYTDRLMATLAVAFAVLAAILAAVGLYGTVSYSVARRTREFGIRLVLGQAPRGLLLAVMREVGWIVAAGIVLGLPVSYGLARLAETELFGIRARDPWTMALATVLVALVGVCAGALPALRAMRIQPLTALRHE